MARDVFNDMTEELFFCQKSYGNTTRFNFIYRHIFFSVSVSGTFGRSDQIFFRYDQRSTKIILCKRGNFGESKLLWEYNGLKFIFERFFVFVRSNQKVASYQLVQLLCKKLHENPQNGSLLDV